MSFLPNQQSYWLGAARFLRRRYRCCIHWRWVEYPLIRRILQLWSIPKILPIEGWKGRNQKGQRRNLFERRPCGIRRRLWVLRRTRNRRRFGDKIQRTISQMHWIFWCWERKSIISARGDIFTVYLYLHKPDNDFFTRLISQRIHQMED